MDHLLLTVEVVAVVKAVIVEVLVVDQVLVAHLLEHLIVEAQERTVVTLLHRSLIFLHLIGLPNLSLVKVTCHKMHHKITLHRALKIQFSKVVGVDL